MTFSALLIALGIIAPFALIQAKLITRDEMKAGHDLCVEKVGIDEKVINDTIKGVPPVDSKYGDYLFCFYKTQGYQEENGDINYDTLKEFIRKYYHQYTDKIVDDCKGIEAENPGDRAFKTLQCLMKGMKLADSLVGDAN